MTKTVRYLKVLLINTGLILQAKFKKLSSLAELPLRAFSNDTGCDLTLIHLEQVSPQVFIGHTGWAVEPPEGYFFELHSRSSIYKTDFIMANQVGIIDPGYRGEIMMPLRYIGNSEPREAADYLAGKRFCQLILKKNEAWEIVEVDNFSDSERGQRGFGSTGH